MSSGETTRHLYRPSQELIVKTYREMKRGQWIDIDIEAKELPVILTCLEKTGYYGIRIDTSVMQLQSMRLRAYKGKTGPCFDTGKSAKLQKDYLAVIDDDHHFMHREMRVCEKTANLYQGMAYQGFIEVDQGDQNLIDRLSNDPEPFDCNTFQEDVEKGLASVAEAISERNQKEKAFYPGPFRNLILADGIVLHRGQYYESGSFEFIKAVDSGDLTKVNFDWPHPAVEPETLKKITEESGIEALLRIQLQEIEVKHDIPCHWEVLDHLSLEMKETVLKTIDQKQRNFIITGSDPLDIGGCCPTELVGEANRLVDAGILIKQTSDFPPEVCPVSSYAFREEEFSVNTVTNEEFRKQVVAKLTDTQDNNLMKLLKFSFLVFIIITIILGAVRSYQKMSKPNSLSSIESTLGLKEKTGIVVLFFRSENVCDMCERMKEHSSDTLKQYSNSLSCALNLVQVNYESPEMSEVREEFDIFTSTIVLLRVKDGKIQEQRLIKEVWELTRDSKAFKNVLEAEIKKFCQASQNG